MLARVAAAVALVAPDHPVAPPPARCAAIAGVEAVNAGSQACNGNPGNLVVTPSAAALAVVGHRDADRAREAAARPRPGRGTTAGPSGRATSLPLAVTAVMGGVVIALTRGAARRCRPLFSIHAIVPEPIALLVAIPLALRRPCRSSPRATARRFVVGFVLAAGVLVRGPVPEHRGAAAAVDARQRLPGHAADLPVRVPVPGQHGRPQRRDLVRDAAVRAPDRVPRRRLRRGRLLGLGLAAGGRRRTSPRRATPAGRTRARRGRARPDGRTAQRSATSTGASRRRDGGGVRGRRRDRRREVRRAARPPRRGGG